MNNEIIIHTDGGARGNPGPAAIGVYIEQNGEVIGSFGKTIGETTNNVAEYTAVIEALQYVKGLKMKDQGLKINFFLDSLLVVNQLNGLFKIKDNKLRELSLKIRTLEQDLSAGRQGSGIVITYQAVRREFNKEADALVNKALDDNE